MVVEGLGFDILRTVHRDIFDILRTVHRDIFL